MELVVCVPAGLLHDGLYLNSNSKFNEIIETISDSRFAALRDKTAKGEFSIENNVSVRQLVVYIFMKQEDNFFIYQRTIKTGETRLAGLYALPGGHMNSLSHDFMADVQNDTLRELTEEIKFVPKGKNKAFPSEDGTKLKMKIVGILQSSCDEDANLVQLVHTGVIVRVDIDKDYDIQLNEDSMTKLTKINDKNYLDYLDKSEKWLQILLAWLPQLSI